MGLAVRELALRVVVWERTFSQPISDVVLRPELLLRFFSLTL